MAIVDRASRGFAEVSSEILILNLPTCLHRFASFALGTREPYFSLGATPGASFFFPLLSLSLLNTSVGQCVSASHLP